MILRVALPGEAKSLRDGAEGKPSLKWRLEARTDKR